MARNILPRSKKAEEEVKTAVEAQPQQDARIIERRIDLELLNDKLNYLIGSINKIAEACEVNLQE